MPTNNSGDFMQFVEYGTTVKAAHKFVFQYRDNTHNVGKSWQNVCVCCGAQDLIFDNDFMPPVVHTPTSDSPLWKNQPAEHDLANDCVAKAYITAGLEGKLVTRVATDVGPTRGNLYHYMIISSAVLKTETKQEIILLYREVDSLELRIGRYGVNARYQHNFFTNNCTYTNKHDKEAVSAPFLNCEITAEVIDREVFWNSNEENHSITKSIYDGINSHYR